MSNKLPPGLVSNLQNVLSNRKGSEKPEETNTESVASSDKVEAEFDEAKPIVFVTNADGIDSPGLRFLVQALVAQGLYNVFVCAPQS